MNFILRSKIKMGYKDINFVRHNMLLNELFVNNLDLIIDYIKKAK